VPSSACLVLAARPYRRRSRNRGWLDFALARRGLIELALPCVRRESGRPRRNRSRCFSFADETGDMIERRLPFLQTDRCRQRLAMALSQRGKRRLDAGRYLPAVAGGAAPARGLRVDDDGVEPGARGLDGRMQSGVAGADDQHIGRARQGGPVFGLLRAVLPTNRVRGLKPGLKTVSRVMISNSSVIGKDHVGALFRHHDGGCIGVARGDRGEDRGVDHAQIVNSMTRSRALTTLSAGSRCPCGRC
jgi:hypothetical protein